MEKATELTQEIKDWFGDGEVDVDLMIRMGVIKPQQILDQWNYERELRHEAGLQ